MMNEVFDSKEVRFVLEALRKASRVAQAVAAEMVPEALLKEDRSPVTVADFAVQAVVARCLQESFPADALVGEEDADVLREEAQSETLARITDYVAREYAGISASEVCREIDHGNGEPHGRFWTLDPIDGTKGFLRGDQYVVALALIEDGQVRLGGLAAPRLGEAGTPDHDGPGSLAIAQVGQGSWVSGMNGDDFSPLRVNARENPAEARLLRSMESGHTNESQIERVAGRLGTQQDPVRMDSQAKYLVLSSGGAELLFRLLSSKQPNYREKIWDQAAGSLLVTEAGGKISDLDGKPLDFSQGKTLSANRGVLASNGHLHPAALDALRAVEA